METKKLIGELSPVSALNGNVYHGELALSGTLYGEINRIDDEDNVSETKKLIGELSPVGILSGNVYHGELNPSGVIYGTVYRVIDHVEPINEYDGSYEVTPSLNNQVLETQDRKMREDLTVKKIPISTTSNPYGGQTVLIG